MTLPKTHTIFPLHFRHTTIRHLTSPQAGNNSFGGKKHKRKKNFRKAQKLNSSRLILKPKKKEKKHKKNTMKKIPSSLHLHDHLHSSPKSRRNSPSLPASRALNPRASRRRRRQPPLPPRLCRLGQLVKTAGGVEGSVRLV
jgi:hypothetical protein